MLRRTIMWAVVIFAGYYLYTQPASASHFAHGAWHAVGALLRSLAIFVSSL